MGWAINIFLKMIKRNIRKFLRNNFNRSNHPVILKASIYARYYLKTKAPISISYANSFEYNNAGKKFSYIPRKITIEGKKKRFNSLFVIPAIAQEYDYFLACKILLKEIIKSKHYKSQDKKYYLLIVALDIFALIQVYRYERDVIDREVLENDSDTIFTSYDKKFEDRIGVNIEEYETSLCQFISEILCLGVVPKYILDTLNALVMWIDIRLSKKYINENFKSLYKELAGQVREILPEYIAISANKISKLGNQGAVKTVTYELMDLSDMQEQDMCHIVYENNFSGYSYDKHINEFDKRINNVRGLNFKIFRTNSYAGFSSNGCIWLNSSGYYVKECLNVIGSQFYMFCEECIYSTNSSGVCIETVKEECDSEVFLVPGKGFSYYHWVVETVPLLIIVNKYFMESGCKNDHLKYCFPYQIKHWHEDWLKLIGISNYETIDKPERFKSKNAYSATLPAYALMPSSATLILRKFLEPVYEGMCDKKSEKYVLTRDNALSARAVVSFDDMVKAEYSDYIKIDPSNMTLHEQLMIFASCSALFIEGSAACLNIMFLDKCETKIVALDCLYYDTFSALASLFDANINYILMDTNLSAKCFEIWNYGHER